MASLCKQGDGCRPKEGAHRSGAGVMEVAVEGKSVQNDGGGGSNEGTPRCSETGIAIALARERRYG